MTGPAPGLDEAKRRVRLELRHARVSLPRAQRRDAEARINDALSTHLLDAKVVGLYAGSRSEVCLDRVAAELSTRGVRLAWPRVEEDKLVFHFADLPALVAGYRGLREPRVQAPRCNPAMLDALLVPGVGFDRTGQRLGQGGGFYDRFLAQAPHVRTIGIAFSAQLVTSLPVGSNDVRVHHIMTEDGLITAPS